MFIGLLNGGPGTPSPGHVAGRSVSLKFAIQMAYGVKAFQVAGSDSIDSRWDIEAKVRTGATAEDFKLMLQNLLQDRFHLKVHHEARIFSAYTLVLAKDGLKLKSSIDIGNQSKQTGIAEDLDTSKGPGGGGTAPAEGGSQILRGRVAGMTSLALMLQASLGGAPVSDMTGLTKTYDFRLQFQKPNSGDNDDSPYPALFSALESELGLMLQPGKVPFDVVVVDHVDKAPTEN